MSRSKLAAIVLAVALAAAAAFVLLRSGPSGGEESDGAKARGNGPAAAPLTARTRPALPGAPGAPPGSAAPQAREGVAVGRDQTEATVNGVAITGADLLAFRAEDGDRQTMSPEVHELLLQRAIERELTIQAARARKIELTSIHDAQLAQVRQNALARGETDPARLAFEDREARAQLLLEEVAKAEGAPPALADDKAVDAYLKAHAAEIGPLPKKPEALQELRISVRQSLIAAVVSLADLRIERV